jgi:hypothetical protein
MKTTTGRAKYYLLFALFFVALLVIVSALWDTSSEKKTGPLQSKALRQFMILQDCLQKHQLKVIPN